MRPKLLLKYHEQGFGGPYPIIEILDVQTMVNKRLLPPGVEINPDAVESKLYHMDEKDQKVYDACSDLMATVIYTIGTFYREDVVELSLLLATPEYRNEAIEALDYFVTCVHRR